MAANPKFWLISIHEEPPHGKAVSGAAADLLKQRARKSELQGREGCIQGETCIGS